MAFPKQSIVLSRVGWPGWMTDEQILACEAILTGWELEWEDRDEVQTTEWVRLSPESKSVASPKSNSDEPKMKRKKSRRRSKAAGASRKPSMTPSPEIPQGKWRLRLAP
ncbi:hypothetical protein B0H14DRAFT_3131109 [Mycena olivaceomarginata]|nr:hypothetical protein B0H14DRAFT_3131109 [Mycena olivaceomarginata]